MLWLVAALTASAPQRRMPPPEVTYTVRADPTDTSGFDVAIHLRHAPASFELAMYRHPEYDDRYWRYLDGVSVDGAGTRITRADSAVWRVTGAASDVTVRYRLRLPPETGLQRQAWRPFLTLTGGLVDGPHALLYVVGAEGAPARVVLSLPDGWRVATPLRPTADPSSFFASSVAELMDSPILFGRFHDWSFTVDDAPHRVVYWESPDARPFDTLTFVSHLAGVVREAVALFGRPPYAQYTFLYRDRAWGALEHPDAVTLGAPSADLAADPDAELEETAHEFFHAWNLMRIHPAGYGGVTYRPRPLSTGLWVSEGFTMFYADLLPRRAGLTVGDSTRAAHLERLLGRYYENPVFARFSAERISQSSYAPNPAFLGDYQGSTHLNGEVLGAMLDLLIRGRTGGRRSLDDVMRGLAADSAGFTTGSVQRLVARTCGCDVRAFFDRYVRHAGVVDANRYLGLIGLHADTAWVPAVDDSGRATPDLRVWSYLPPGSSRPAILLGTPFGAWGRAGLHSGDLLESVGDSSVTSVAGFRAVLVRLRIGDTVPVVVRRGHQTLSVRVVISGFKHAVVRISRLGTISDGQRRLLAAWEAGATD